MSLSIKVAEGLLSYSSSAKAKNVFVQSRAMQVVFVGFCILLGTVLRGFQLGSQNFWYDELEAIRYASDLSLHDVHPPLYYVLLHLTLNIGHSEFILRFPSLIAGVLSIPLVYVIGKQILPRSANLVSTFLVSISPLLIWHSQDTRMYSLLAFVCLLVVYTYLRALRLNNWISWASYFLAATLAIYTHLYAFLLLGSLALHFLIFKRKLIKPWLISHLALALVYLPWLVIFVDLPEKQIGTGHATGILSFFYNYFVFINGYSLGAGTDELRSRDLRVIIPYLPLIVPIMLVSLLAFFVGLNFLRKASLEIFVLLVSWAFLPTLIANIIPYLRTTMTFNVRYVLFGAPAFLFILGVGITQLKPRYLGVACLIILVLYNAISLYNSAFDQTYAKEDVRNAAQFIALHAAPDDHILVITVGRVFMWYFAGENSLFFNVPYQPPKELVDEAAKDSSSIWLVKSRAWQTDPGNEIQTTLDKDYTLLSTNEFSGVSVYHYKSEISSDK